MDKIPKVSIGLPVFNEDNFLKKLSIPSLHTVHSLKLALSQEDILKELKNLYLHSQLRIELNESFCKGVDSGKRTFIPYKNLIRLRYHYGRTRHTTLRLGLLRRSPFGTNTLLH